MDEAMILAFVLMVAGLLNMVLVGRFLVSESFGKKYIKESPKALLLREIFGEDKAYEMTKKIFAPIGLVLGFGMLCYGAYIM
jgi:hypothetical protein